MSSGFVPAGSDADSTKPDDAWVRAQQLVAQSKSTEAKPSRLDDGKSLYDVLQQNKAAKQEAFEEAARLKNQFRSLDDDEVDFLDSVLESTRAKEAEVRKETASQLELFRKQREAAEKAQFEDTTSASAGATATSPPAEQTWAARPKKRRRDKDHTVLAQTAKLRKTSSAEADRPDFTTSNNETNVTTSGSARIATASEAEGSDTASAKPSEASKPKGKAAPAIVLGLGDYSSDDD